MQIKVCWYASINVKPEGGGGGTPGICGTFGLCCLSQPLEFDLKSGSQGGDVCFFAQRNRTKSHHSMCLSVFRAARKALKDACFQFR